MSSMEASRGTEPARSTEPASKHRLYHVWANMIARCHNPNSTRYSSYGAKGIHVCERWRASFWNFANDCNRQFRPGLTIDRIDNAKGYEPSNVRFVGPDVQARNRTNNVWIEYGGETRCAADLAREHGLTPVQFNNRRRLGWSIEKTLTTPVRPKKRGTSTAHIRYELDGESLTLPEISERRGISVALLRQRLADDWSIEEAASAPKNITRKTAIEIDGELASVAEWCRRFGISRRRYEVAVGKGERPIDALKRLSAKDAP